ncbi:hypothetical protein VTK73DRAFT_2751 [Phialemonium thermophilum]|uniref:Thioesterase domain-containing protein n=1 Tax=Phialemonium thermophilum TaxID=223376 RepID=A0ABR3Y2B9_9PEZI
MVSRIRQRPLVESAGFATQGACIWRRPNRFAQPPWKGQSIQRCTGLLYPQHRLFSAFHYLRQQGGPEGQRGSRPTIELEEKLGTPPNSAEPSQPSVSSRRPRRRLSRLLSAALFLLAGTIAGSSLRLLITPPVPPTPGTEADAYTISVLRSEAAKLPIVAELTADTTNWDTWPAYADLRNNPDAAKSHLTAGTLAGSRGIGAYQQVFRHRTTGEIVVVVYIGASTSGWPGVVHGGCLATLLDETGARAAVAGLEPSAAGGGGGPASVVTARLELRYLNPTLANGFYVVRARSRPEEELDPAERGKRSYKAFVDASIEDAVSGKVCVAAEALFVRPVRRKKATAGSKADPSSDGVAEYVFRPIERF